MIRFDKFDKLFFSLGASRLVDATWPRTITIDKKRNILWNPGYITSGYDEILNRYIKPKDTADLGEFLEFGPFIWNLWSFEFGRTASDSCGY